MTTMHPDEEPDRDIEEAWLRFIMLKDKAMATEEIEDAVAAGRAWAKFLELFVPQRVAFKVIEGGKE